MGHIAFVYRGWSAVGENSCSCISLRSSQGTSIEGLRCCKRSETS